MPGRDAAKTDRSSVAVSRAWFVGVILVVLTLAGCSPHASSVRPASSVRVAPRTATATPAPWSAPSPSPTSVPLPAALVFPSVSGPLPAQTSNGCSHDAMTFVDARHGWLALDEGVIAATIDGGKDWVDEYRASQPQASIQSLDFVDAKDGFALVSWPGTPTANGLPWFEDVIRTVDGGLTWSIATPTSVGITCLDFLTPSVGYALTANGQLVVTTDGGTAWAGVPTPGATFTACFETGGEGWIGTKQAVERTSDGGAHWNRSYIPSGVLSEGISPLDRVQCLGQTAWFLMKFGAGMNQEAALVVRTLNGGDDWQAVDNQGIGGPEPGTPAAPDILQAHPGPFQLTGADSACLTSSSSVSIDVRVTTTADGGLHVTQHEIAQNGDAVEGAAGLAFISPDEGWLLLSGDLLNITTAANRTGAGSAAHLTGDPKRYFILLQTFNAGVSWTQLTSFDGAIAMS